MKQKQQRPKQKPKQRIAIVDYGMGNIHSVKTAVQAVQQDDALISCTREIQALQEADKLIFPGVGAMRDTMEPLQQQGLASALPALLLSKPSLAICVGLQALPEFSEENQGINCLALLPARVRRFALPAMQKAEQNRTQKGEQANTKAQPHFKIPHIGWNRVKQSVDHPLWHGIPDESYFYFVHSYYLDLADQNLLAGTCDYGINFPAAVCKGTLFATQFHPEKSDQRGLQLIRNFLRWDGRL